MKLISACVQNYRVLSGQNPIEVKFDPAIQLIEGPNEIGKSTFMSAVRDALLLKASGQTAHHQSIVPHSGEKPEVTVVFEVEGTRWTVRKRFSGPNGRCYLDSDTEHLEDAKAETRLMELLGRSKEGYKDDQVGVFLLTYIRQGASANDPLESLNDDTRTRLQNLLQSESREAVLSSEGQRITALVREEYLRHFTEKTGKLAENSDAAKAARLTKQLTEELAEAVKRRDSVSQQAEEYQQKRQRIQVLDRELPLHTEAVRSNEDILRKHDLLQGQIKTAQQAVQIAESQLRSLVGFQERIEEAKNTALAAEKELESASHTAEVLKTTLSSQQQEETTQTTGLAGLETRSAESVRRLNRARKTAELRSKSTALINIGGQRERGEGLDKEIGELQGQLNRNQITSEVLENLRELEAKRAEAQVKLDAAGVAISVRSRLPLNIEQSGRLEQPSGDWSSHATDHTRITLGTDDAVVDITPGGDDLEKRKRALSKADEALRKALADAGVETLAQASQFAEARRNLEQELRLKQHDLAALAPDGLDALRADEARIRIEHAQVKSDLEALHRSDDPALPEDAAELEELLLILEEEQRQAGKDLQAAKLQLVEVRGQIQGSRNELRRIEENIAGINQRIKDARNRVQLLQNEHGTPDTLAAKIQAQQTVLHEAQADLNALQSQQQNFDRAYYEAELQRCRQVLANAEKEKNEALGACQRLEGAIAQELGGQTGEGLHARCGALEADLEQARTEQQRTQLRADAAALVHHLFEDERRATEQRIQKPLTDAMAALLRRLFPKAEVILKKDEKGGQSIDLRRGDQESFDQLSYGTREQIAVIVRLALAQVMAKDHGGCLPVVLDDPLVNSDPDRQTRMVAILHHVARAGNLQLIILTCDPYQYEQLGLGSSQHSDLRQLKLVSTICRGK